MTNDQIELYKHLSCELAQRADDILAQSALNNKDKGAAVLTTLNMMVAKIAHSFGVDPEQVLRCQAEAVAMVYELNVAFIGSDESEALKEREGSEVH